MDNTFAGFHQHGEFEIDLFVHSLTKYASGAGDVMGGAVIGRSELIRGMRDGFRHAGRHARSARRVPDSARAQDLLCALPGAVRERACELQSCWRRIRRLRECTIPGCQRIPSMSWREAQMKEFGTIVTFDLKGGAEAGGKFAGALKLFALTASLGSTESLVVAPQMMGGRDLTPDSCVRRLSRRGRCGCLSAWKIR